MPQIFFLRAKWLSLRHHFCGFLTPIFPVCTRKRNDNCFVENCLKLHFGLPFRRDFQLQWLKPIIWQKHSWCRCIYSVFSWYATFEIDFYRSTPFLYCRSLLSTIGSPSQTHSIVTTFHWMYLLEGRMIVESACLVVSGDQIHIRRHIARLSSIYQKTIR